MILALLIWVPMLILLQSSTLLRKLQVCTGVINSCLYFLSVITFTVLTWDFSHNFCRWHLSPWANDTVPVLGFSWHQLQGRSSPAELHRGAGRIIANGLLATSWRRGSPILGRPWGPDTNWNGHQVLGHGHCQQKAGHAHSIRVKNSGIAIPFSSSRDK